MDNPKRIHLRIDDPVTPEEIGYLSNGIREITDTGKFVVVIEKTIQLC